MRRDVMIKFNLERDAAVRNMPYIPKIHTKEEYVKCKELSASLMGKTEIRNGTLVLCMCGDRDHVGETGMVHELKSDGSCEIWSGVDYCRTNIKAIGFDNKLEGIRYLVVGHIDENPLYRMR